MLRVQGRPNKILGTWPTKIGPGKSTWYRVVLCIEHEPETNPEVAFTSPIKIVDVFAGPGGLGEGFSSVMRDRSRAFELVLSMEKDEIAHRTLMLRSFFRKFAGDNAPDAYYDYVTGEISRKDLLGHPELRAEWAGAADEARCIALGETTHSRTDAWIRKALGGTEDWVLIGGPPCQAYSLAGRSRRRPVDNDAFESDEKHFLYKQYLRILRLYAPAVFVMENVKGMISSTQGGTLIFERIMEDLARPSREVEYDVHSLVLTGSGTGLKPADYVIESELYGIPQARHRVILLGVRKGFRSGRPRLLRKAEDAVSVEDVISDLPKIRSRISRGNDSFGAWIAALESAKDQLTSSEHHVDAQILAELDSACALAAQRQSSGAQFIPYSKSRRLVPKCHSDWYSDTRLPGVLQHDARSHMVSDLGRYLFLSSYGRVHGSSPNLRAIPDVLLPKHKNVGKDDTPFLDRFRVQIAKRPSTTVVSHIAKDGHYYVHPDPSQCRSMTVREAARLQTFPDNYFFEGNRTEQYTQVGNAVPPLLARQIAKVVLQLFLSDGNAAN